ncbi:hypothetical protein NKV53_04460 [Legionella sp. 27cVA30]|uniref:hypothetical protein n=1 Tax=Legionella TaxID=445 RepID=UPI000F8DEAA3|nr:MULTISPECIES: hypothetical protein [Legionella]MCP0913618.1 hypothetical protein [Legionella sp. 27cVA30]RUR12702.1 hypothetical protein ELY10_11375 [Legionella septentrionalis]
MENLNYLFGLWKKYNWFYFNKQALCKNYARKIYLVCQLIIIGLCIAFCFHAEFDYLICVSVLVPPFFLFSYIPIKLINADYKKPLQELGYDKPLFQKKYFAHTLYEIRESLKKDNRLTHDFLNKTIKQCRIYLELENSKGHPLWSCPR